MSTRKVKVVNAGDTRLTINKPSYEGNLMIDGRRSISGIYITTKHKRIVIEVYDSATNNHGLERGIYYQEIGPKELKMLVEHIVQVDKDPAAWAIMKEVERD